MGSSSSKFRKHLQNGDEYAALHLYNNNGDLRKALDPNLSYGDNYSHDTPLHLAARHGMKSLLRIFLYEHGGNPNKKNARNETALHNLCISNQSNNFVIQQRRAECLLLKLQWRGATLEDGDVEKVDLGSQDEKDNTALHYAAASGLKRCVELLVSYNAPLFTENNQKQTPCDSAEKNSHNDIALYLESKMVFSGEDENPDDLEMETILDEMESDEAYSGLRAQDLQEAKDQLLVETSDMLRVPLFTAEALLRNHEWSRESLLEAWMENPIACCEKCGVVPPVTVYSDHSLVTTASEEAHNSSDRRTNLLSHDHELVTPTSSVTVHPADVICDICACFINQSDEPVLMTCDHVFCRGCWERYLTGKIKEGDAHNITCPGFSCTKLVPVDVIETLVSRDMARRYLQFDIKAFVDSNPSIKWCPYPACGRAVRLPEADNPLSPSFRGLMDPNMTKDFSHAVDCGNGHIFCWECMGEAHEPASCDNWSKWHQKMAEIKPEELNGTEEDCEIAGNCLWLVSNSKPCPNCKSPIQKNEGCNHMKCSKCKHDFCWVCLEQWKRHSSSTGGYFRCNRYEIVKKVVSDSDSAKADAEARNVKLQELNRFVHYYTRFKNHEHSFKLEEPLLTTAKEKMMVLAKAVTDPDTANSETKFVEDAVQQLLKGRRVLKCSYVYGFYLQETGYKKPIFEFMQTELEECTEALSEMIARPYLRTPRSKIIQTAHVVQRKRQEFVTAISKGLVPPDTSPNARRKKGRYNLELDEDLKKALMASLSNIDPANPWVKDPSGKHTNVSALLDWPEEEDESDTEDAEVSTISSTTERGTEDNLSLTSDTVAGGIAKCSRNECSKPRAQNPRTGEIHDHCSIKCMQKDKGGADSEESENNKVECGLTDYHMDLLRALEMSRLQFMRDMGQLRPGVSTSSESHSPLTPRTPRSPNPSVTSDTQATPAPASSSNPAPEKETAVAASVACSTSTHDPVSVPAAATTTASPATTHPTTDTTFTTAAVLHDLPPMRRGRVKSEPGERSQVKGRGGKAGGGEKTDLDMELERALEMSRLSLNDEERDLRLAIELSLKDSIVNPKSQQELQQASKKMEQQQLFDCSSMTSSMSHLPLRSQSKSDEKIQMTARNPDYSSVVARVPNRSVEDLSQDAISGSAVGVSMADAMGTNFENMGACGGLLLSPNKQQKSPKIKQVLIGGHLVIPNMGPKANQQLLQPQQKPNPFGVIKDISVTNINIGDVDKTRSFEDKKFDGLLAASSAKMGENAERYQSESSEFRGGEKQMVGGVDRRERFSNTAFSHNNMNKNIDRPGGGIMSGMNLSSCRVIGNDLSMSDNTNVIDDGCDNHSNVNNTSIKYNKPQNLSSNLVAKANKLLSKTSNSSKESGKDKSKSSSSSSQAGSGKKNKIREAICSDVFGGHSSKKLSVAAPNNRHVLEEEARLLEQHCKAHQSESSATPLLATTSGGEEGLCDIPSHNIDPDDLHIDSGMLESMIQGVDDYHSSQGTSSNNNLSVEHFPLTPIETNMDSVMDQLTSNGTGTGDSVTELGTADNISTDHSPLVSGASGAVGENSDISKNVENNSDIRHLCKNTGNDDTNSEEEEQQYACVILGVNSETYNTALSSSASLSSTTTSNHVNGSGNNNNNNSEEMVASPTSLTMSSSTSSEHDDRDAVFV